MHTFDKEPAHSHKWDESRGSNAQQCFKYNYTHFAAAGMRYYEYYTAIIIQEVLLLCDKQHRMKCPRNDE